MRGGREFALYLLHDVFIDDCLRRLAGNATGNLRQIAATHIQLVGIEMHIAIGAAEVIHLRDKLIVKFRTPDSWSLPKSRGSGFTGSIMPIRMVSSTASLLPLPSI